MKYQQIGDIAIFNKISKQQAIAFLKNTRNTRFRTICLKLDIIQGKKRIPSIKIITTKEKNKKKITETITKESGILYKLDIKKVMFSKGNINERHRIAKQIKKEEIILDMFAGIGYFAIPFAKKCKKIYCIDINKDSIYYLKENCKLNKVNNFKIFIGDCRKIIPELNQKFDRISMGYLPDTFPFFKSALKASKKGTIIHYHCLLNRIEMRKNIANLLVDLNQYKNNIKLLHIQKVKQFSPSKLHYVLDLEVI